jgi:hypothetical protein
MTGDESNAGETDRHRSASRRATLAALGGAAVGGVLTQLAGPLATGSAAESSGRDGRLGQPVETRTTTRQNRELDGWRQTDVLTVDTGRIAAFGYSLALDGDWLLIGVPAIDVVDFDDPQDGVTGMALLYEWVDDCWEQRRQLRPSGDEPEFGSSVALAGDGSVAAVGAPNYSDRPGRVYIYERRGRSWESRTQLTASNASDGDNFGFGLDLSTDGTTLLAGRSSGDPETAHVFTRGGNNWRETARLLSSDDRFEGFGLAVALDGDGDRAVVGTPSDSERGYGGGGANIFEREGSQWVEKLEVKQNQGDSNAYGAAVTLDDAGRKAVIGSPVHYPDHFEGPGFLGVVERTGEGWQPTKRLRRPDGTEEENLGESLALTPDGRTFIAGDPNDTVGGTERQGSATVFSMVADQWSNLSKLVARDGQRGDRFGTAVALDDDATLAAVSAPARGTGGRSRGAVYVFERGVRRTPPKNGDGDGDGAPGLVDSFEDGNLSEYTSLGGPLSDWSVQSEHATHGTRALQYDGGSAASDITSLSGLPRYPARGDVFRFDFLPRGDWDFYTTFNFGQQPNSAHHNRYELELDPRNDEIRFQFDIPGTERDESLGSAGVEFNRRSAYTVEIDWQARGDDIEITVFEGLSAGDALGWITATPPDGAPDSGGVGFFARGEGDRWVYDHIRIVE